MGASFKEIASITTKKKKKELQAMSGTIIFFADDWGYSFGGINVFNYMLFLAMGKIKNIKTICVSQHIDENKRKQATDSGVILVNVDKTDYDNADAIIGI